MFLSLNDYIRHCLLHHQKKYIVTAPQASVAVSSAERSHQDQPVASKIYNSIAACKCRRNIITTHVTVRAAVVVKRTTSIICGPCSCLRTGTTITAYQHHHFALVLEYSMHHWQKQYPMHHLYRRQKELQPNEVVVPPVVITGPALSAVQLICCIQEAYYRMHQLRSMFCHAS
jgi:hypothetical protein